jgi:hypothetical protein
MSLMPVIVIILSEYEGKSMKFVWHMSQAQQVSCVYVTTFKIAQGEGNYLCGASFV